MTVSSIAAVLGGNSVLRRKVGTSQELVALTREGLPAGTLDQLAEQMGLSRAVVARALGISDRTLSRRLHAEARLTAAESDRAVRMARILAHARETLGTAEHAAQWLMTPNRVMGGDRPFERLDTDAGAQSVETVLGRIAYGLTAFPGLAGEEPAAVSDL